MKTDAPVMCYFCKRPIVPQPGTAAALRPPEGPEVLAHTSHPGVAEEAKRQRRDPSFLFQDGHKPPQAVIDQISPPEMRMEWFSWPMHIATFRAVAAAVEVGKA